MKALPGYIIVTPIKEEEGRTTEGLYIPPSKDRPVKGRIVDMGNFIGHEMGNLKVGDIVYHRRWSGDEIKEGEKEYRIVKFEDCMALE